MNNALERIREWLEVTGQKWKGLTLNQKVLIGGAVLLTLISIGILISNRSGKNFQPLYTNLSMEDAAAITKKLDESKIEYQLAQEGTTIMVPGDQKYRIRLMLAGEGLPQGTAGLELFQKPQFGETETDKRVKYLAALQGELVRTIQSLDKIQSARVHLVLPEPSLYSDKEEPATASVMLKVKPGEELTSKEILGIVNLVANSVERLKPENVVVVDQYGNLLSTDIPNPGSLSTTDLSAQQMAIKRQFEREKQQAIQTMLDTTLGAGKAVVRVSAELNFDEVERFSQNFNPDKRVVISKHTVEESSTSTNQEATAAPGVDTNVPTYQGTQGATGTSTSDKSDKTVNYEGDKVETKTKMAPGAVKRLTVAVLVDQGFQSKKQAIVDAVRNASGADARRRDSVSVDFIKFQPVTQELPTTAASPLKKYALPLAVVVLLLLGTLAWVVARRRKAAVEGAESFEALVDEEIPVESLVERELTPEEKEKKKIREEIDKLVEEHPADAAQIIRGWLLEEKR